MKTHLMLICIPLLTLLACSNGDTYEIQFSTVEDSQIITDLKNVNSELLSTVPPGTRGRWTDKERWGVVCADVAGACVGGKTGAYVGTKVGLVLGNPLTGGVFGAFLGGVIGGAHSSWLADPEEAEDEAVNSIRVEEACEVLINDDLSINEGAICYDGESGYVGSGGYTKSAKSTITNKLYVEEELIAESKLDENSLKIGKAHNIILAVMDGSVILKNEVTLKNAEHEQSEFSDLKNALFNSEDFINECKVTGEAASVGIFLTSDEMLSRVMELFNQALEEYPSTIDDVAFIIGKYVDIIEESNELTTEQKQYVKSGLATALYSFKYWESRL